MGGGGGVGVPDCELESLQPEERTVFSNELQPKQLSQPAVLARVRLISAK
jgi:hypothetical protein